MSKISDALFSKSTQAILANVFLRPEGMHLRALMSATGLGSASAQRELRRLTEAGVLVRVGVGRVTQYRANRSSPIFEELRSMVTKTFGVADVLRDALLPFQEQIARAFIYGSVAKGTDTGTSDIDVLVLAEEIGSADLYPALISAEQMLGRKISLTVYRPDEFQRKLKSKNHFLATVMAGPIIALMGEADV